MLRKKISVPNFIQKPVFCLLAVEYTVVNLISIGISIHSQKISVITFFRQKYIYIKKSNFEFEWLYLVVRAK